MAETHEHQQAPAVPDSAIGDRDVDLKAVFAFIGGLVGASAVVLAVVWALSIHFKEALVQSDPAPSPLPEAHVRSLPPEPRLEEAPRKNLAELRGREDAVLKGWRWVDKERGVAGIPIERAIDIVAEKGLPAPPEGGKK